MKEQLIQFLTGKNISATRLADEIGVQRSSISHILSGRNKPSYDFIEKMLKTYPDLSADWLITGQGNMFKNQAQEIIKPLNIVEKDLFSGIAGNKSNHENRFEHITDKAPEPNTKQEKNDQFTNVNTIERIVLFYSNGFFKEYKPSDSKI